MGKVFPVHLTQKRMSKIITAIGKRAGVKVDTFTRIDPETKTKHSRTKYASAHDLRRAFGTRWAVQVAPAVLQKLMRHSSIETTMKYYVDLDTDDIADQLWAKFDGAHTSAHTSKEERQPESSGRAK